MSSPEALCVAFAGGNLLVREGTDEEVPTLGEVKASGLEVRFLHGLAPIGGGECVAVALDPDAVAPAGMSLRDFRDLIGLSVNEELFSRAGRARMISDWHANNRFCGRCATETVQAGAELCMRCPNCGASFFPKISPAAIILVRDEKRLLLARSPHFPPNMYSALAGFVEPGEPVEETVRREIREEVGVEVGDVRYFGSQPWPFPDSLMLGFMADYAGGELVLQDDEIEDAGWFTAENLPLLPPRLSIARLLIDAFLEEKGVGKGE